MDNCIKAACACVLAAALQAPAVAAESEPVKGTPSTKSETAKADAARKKPLQRCDQLADKAQLDCLDKARENIVEARRKRETVGAKAEAKASAPTDGEKKTK